MLIVYKKVISDPLGKIYEIGNFKLSFAGDPEPFSGNHYLKFSKY